MRAPGHLRLFIPEAGDEVALLLHSAKALFDRNAPSITWGRLFEQALDLLAEKKHRLKVQLVFASWLVEDCQRREHFLLPQAGAAHIYYLDVLCHLEQELFPDIHLLVLWRLVHLEWKMHQQESPPMAGVYFNLARVHETMLFAGHTPSSIWGCHAWGSLVGITAQWYELHRLQRGIEPLHGLMFLGLAAVGGHDNFIDTHADAVRAAIADSWDASTRCEQFTHELEELHGALDEPARQKVIVPWRSVLEWVYE